MASADIEGEMLALCVDWPLSRLPDRRHRAEDLPHAPNRNPVLSDDEKRVGRKIIRHL